MIADLRVPLLSLALALVVGFVANSQAVFLINEDFDSLSLTPGTPSYTDVIPGWTRDNSAMEAPSSNPAYDGGTVLDIAEWIAEQGVQAGRNSTGVLSSQALIFEPDAWDDFSSASSTGYNSYWSVDVSLLGLDRSTLEISFDYEFVSEDSQVSLVEISFDGGSSWTNLLLFDSKTVVNNTFFSSAVDQSFFSASNGDFTPTSDNVTLRFGTIESGNDWWFGIDNVTISAVPEPSALLLSLLAIPALFRRDRRR